MSKFQLFSNPLVFLLTKEVTHLKQKAINYCYYQATITDALWEHCSTKLPWENGSKTFKSNFSAPICLLQSIFRKLSRFFDDGKFLFIFILHSHTEAGAFCCSLLHVFVSQWRNGIRRIQTAISFKLLKPLPKAALIKSSCYFYWCTIAASYSHKI